MSDHSFELKGSLFPLSVLYCQDLSAAAVKTQLQQKLAQAPAFFYRAPVVINVESVTQAPDFEAIAQVFKELELVLVGVCGASAELKKVAQAAGLASLQLSKNKTPAKETKEKEAKTEAAVAAPLKVVWKMIKPCLWSILASIYFSRMALTVHFSKTSLGKNGTSSSNFFKRNV